MISASTTSPGQPERLDSVDALRGIAFLCVLLVHAAQAVPDFFGRSAALAGCYGVSLFFIASAFTLFASHQKRSGFDRAPLPAFFIRRTFRILPLFWAGILFYYAMHGTWNRGWAEGTLGWFHFGLTATILHGWHPDTINSVVPGGWSIAAEFGFYFLAPWLFSLITDLRRAIVGYALAVVLALILNDLARAGLVATLFPHVPAWRQDSFSYFWLPAHLPTFLLGFIVFFLRARCLNYPLRLRRAALLAIATVLLLAANLLHGDLAEYLFPLLLAILVLAVLVEPTAILVNRFTRTLGTLSFSAYITHFAALQVMKKIFPAPMVSGELYFLLLFSGALVITVCISGIAYYTIEQPGIELGRRLIRARFASPRPACLVPNI